MKMKATQKVLYFRVFPDFIPSGLKGLSLGRTHIHKIKGWGWENIKALVMKSGNFSGPEVIGMKLPGQSGQLP